MRITSLKKVLNSRLLCLASLVLGCLAVLLGGQQAAAATLYWDPNGAASGTGGAGDWNFTDTAWRDGSTSGTLQAWTDNNDINLTGAAGIITLKDNITVGQNGSGVILSGTSGYTINADPGKSLTFDATGGINAYRVSTNAGNLTINAPVILKGYDQNPRGSVTFNGDISEVGGSYGLVKNFGTTMTLNGNNTFTGGVVLSDGVLVVGNDNALGTGTLNWGNGEELAAGGGDRTLPNNVTGSWNFLNRIIGTNNLTFSGNYEAMSAYTSAFWRLEVVEAGTQATFENFTTLTSGSPKGFKKQGAGTMILDGVFAPDKMDMTIEAGTMLVNTNASATTSGADFLVTTGTLGGTGTINLGAGSLVDVSAGGTLAPGASVGTLTVNGDVNLDGSLATEFLGSTSDLLVVNGNLTLGSSSVLQYVNALDGESDYTIASYTGTLTGTFGSINGFAPYSIDYGTGMNSQITLHFIPAPEPSSFFLLGCGALGLLLRKKSRRAKA